MYEIDFQVFAAIRIRYKKERMHRLLHLAFEWQAFQFAGRLGLHSNDFRFQMHVHKINLFVVCVLASLNAANENGIVFDVDTAYAHRNRIRFT